MLRIFRKVRNILIPENRFGRYFFYAIGETLLVVIGILIALKINNWNERVKLESEEYDLLIDLESEFEFNRKSLLNIKNNNSDIYDCTYQLKDLIGENGLEIRKHNVDSLLYRSILIADYQPNQYILSHLKSSDKMRVLRSELLKKLLYEWEYVMNNKTEAFNMWNTYFMNSLIPFLDETVSIRNMDAYGDYRWSSPSPLSHNSTEIFNMIQFDNRLENHMWCLNQFSTSIDQLLDIAIRVNVEISREKQRHKN